MTGGSKKAIVAAFIANLGIAIARFIGFIITRSVRDAVPQAKLIYIEPDFRRPL